MNKYVDFSLPVVSSSSSPASGRSFFHDDLVLTSLIIKLLRYKCWQFFTLFFRSLFECVEFAIHCSPFQAGVQPLSSKWINVVEPFQFTIFMCGGNADWRTVARCIMQRSGFHVERGFLWPGEISILFFYFSLSLGRRPSFGVVWKWIIKIRFLNLN